MSERLAKDAFVAIIMGPSGVGKDTVVAEMEKLGSPPHFHPNKSWTTRAPRPNEPADAYRFVDEQTFKNAETAGEFLQTEEIYGHLYGTPFPEELPEGTIELFNVLAPGAVKVKSYYPNAKIYLIEPPSISELRRRLEDRGLDDADSIELRERAADPELEAGRAIADHRIVNETGKVEETARQLHGLIRADWQSTQAA